MKYSISYIPCAFECTLKIWRVKIAMAGFTLDPRYVGDGSFLRKTYEICIKFFAWRSSTFASSLLRGALHTNCMHMRITVARKTHKRRQFQRQWIGWRALLRRGQQRAMSFGKFVSHDEQGSDVGSSSASVKSSQTSRLSSCHMPAFSWTAITEHRPLELEHASPLLRWCTVTMYKNWQWNSLLTKRRKKRELPIWTSGHFEKYSYFLVYSVMKIP